MNEMLRTILELIGLRESPRAMMQRKLRLVSQSKTPGRATLVVKSLGMKQNSAISALREITDLPRADIIALAGMLPLPLLTNVSMETAVAAQKLLTLIGVESEIVSPDTIPTASQQPAMRETAVSTHRARKPFAVQPGLYTVTLTAVNAYGSDARTRSQYITVTTGAHTWEQIITTHSPLVWGEYAMAYDSGRDVVALYGGNAGGWPYENSTWEFDGTDWEPITTTNQPDAVYGMKMVYDESHNQILLFGGSDNDDTALAETWIFSGTSWLAVTISQSPPARTNHAMAYDSDAGDIYLFGGNDGLAYFNDLWRYDGSAWSQVTISGTMPPPRTLSTLVYDVPGGRLLLFGGREEAGAPLADLWEFDINTSAWTELTASGPAARYAHSMAYNPATGAVIMVGGVSDAGDVVFGDTWQFQNGGWTELEPIPLSGGVAYHTLVYDENTQAFLLVSGGATWEYR